MIILILKENDCYKGVYIKVGGFLVKVNISVRNFVFLDFFLIVSLLNFFFGRF